MARKSPEHISEDGLTRNQRVYGRIIAATVGLGLAGVVVNTLVGDRSHRPVPRPIREAGEPTPIVTTAPVPAMGAIGSLNIVKGASLDEIREGFTKSDEELQATISDEGQAEISHTG